MSVISNLFTLLITVAIIVGGLLLIVSPKSAAPVFKRIGLLLIAFMLWLVLIERLIKALLDRWWFPLLFVLVSIAAYFIREAMRRKQKPVSAPAKGIERTPVMPGQFEENKQSEENRDEIDPVGD
jgi:CDP-diglyceride synthetase